MALTRLTNILQVTTTPTDLTKARAHTGGWSESFWTTLNPVGFEPAWLTQQTKRALLLPSSAAIVGFRTQQYTIAGNKLLPGGSTSGRQNMPGALGSSADLPQVALMLNAAANGAPNNARMILRGMPDPVMVGGEYQPAPFFSALVTQFCNSMIGFNFGFIGRDLSQASVRVLKIANNVITVDQLPGTGLAVGDFIRFHRVYDSGGNPVKGDYVVSTIAGNDITVAGLAVVVTKPSGTLRRDLLTYLPFGNLYPVRAVVKKVGRPFEQYRGRRSKTRV